MSTLSDYWKQVNPPPQPVSLCTSFYENEIKQVMNKKETSISFDMGRVCQENKEKASLLANWCIAQGLKASIHTEEYESRLTDSTYLVFLVKVSWK